MSKKRSPAYYRYKKKHPTVSVTITKELKEALDSYRGRSSYGEAIKKLLRENMDLYSEGYKKGRSVGFNEGEDAGIEFIARMLFDALHDFGIHDLDKLFGFLIE